MAADKSFCSCAKLPAKICPVRDGPISCNSGKDRERKNGITTSMVKMTAPKMTGIKKRSFVKTDDF